MASGATMTLDVPEATDYDSVLKTQALVVTAGSFKDRICENDDDDFLFRSEFSLSDLKWMERNGVVWRKLDAEDDGELVNEVGVDCEVITFGYYLTSPGKFLIPRQFLKPATTSDLISRFEIIEEALFSSVWRQRGKVFSQAKLYDLLLEQRYISDEITRRDKLARYGDGNCSVFLCHASADKPFVRKVYNDLGNAGHKVWLDEFEIKVGDSIVNKINQATNKADALILFVSDAATKSEWVSREWNSALARSLSSSKIKVLPALIEDAELPALLADVKYADFRSSYNVGLEALLVSLNGLVDQNTNS